MSKKLKKMIGIIMAVKFCLKKSTAIPEQVERWNQRNSWIKTNFTV